MSISISFRRERPKHSNQISMPTNLIKRTAVAERKGIKVGAQAQENYEKRDRSLDDDPDSRPLAPDKWANAMRRDEFFRPIKKQTTVRIDADVLDWLRSKGDGHLSRINKILRDAMIADHR